MTAEQYSGRAVLYQAVIDFTSPGHVYGLGAASMQRSVGQWFLSHSHGLGSFLFICEILNINPEWVRKQLFGTSIDVLKNHLATQHRSRDKLASVAPSENGTADNRGATAIMDIRGIRTQGCRLHPLYSVRAKP